CSRSPRRASARDLRSARRAKHRPARFPVIPIRDLTSSICSSLLRAIDAREESPQLGGVDAHCMRALFGGGRLEERAVESLVEQAVAIAIPPQHFGPRRALP